MYCDMFEMICERFRLEIASFAKCAILALFEFQRVIKVTEVQENEQKCFILYTNVTVGHSMERHGVTIRIDLGKVGVILYESTPHENLKSGSGLDHVVMELSVAVEIYAF